MPEHLALQQLFTKRRAVNCHKVLPGTLTTIMYGLGKHLFSGSRFPIDHNRQIARRHHRYIVSGIFHFFIHCDDIFHRKRCAAVFFQLSSAADRDLFRSQFHTLRLFLAVCHLFHRQIDRAHHGAPALDRNRKRADMDALLPLGLQQLVFHVNRQSDLHRPDHAAVLSVQVFKYIEKILSHQRLVSFSLFPV